MPHKSILKSKDFSQVLIDMLAFIRYSVTTAPVAMHYFMHLLKKILIFISTYFQISEINITEHIEGDATKFALWTGRAPISEYKIVLKVSSQFSFR